MEHGINPMGSAPKMQICNWLEASEGRSCVTHGSVLLVCWFSIDVLYRSLAQSHCRSLPAPSRSTMVIGNYRLRFVCVCVCECVSVREREREREREKERESL